MPPTPTPPRPQTAEATATLAVAFDRPRQRERAEALAERLQLPIAQRLADPHDLHLAVASRPGIGDRLELRVNPHQPQDPDSPTKARRSTGKPVAAEPHVLDVTSPAGRKLNSPFFKAIGIRKGNPHRPRVLDLTAGFGEDAWLLAAAGCTVTAFERHPIVHALLEDALVRAAEPYPDITSRITLHHTNLLQRPITTLNPQPKTLYLDPMFPPGRKTAEKKPMRLLRKVVGHDPDADALLLAALDAAPPNARVVVKRPRLAAPLAHRAPVHTHEAKALRYDVYVAHPRRVD